MYFDFLPSIKYDVKPISYPFSESDYVVAKNFFRRYKISDTAFTQSVYFNKYALQDGQRLDQIAETVYNDPNLDWVVILTNNMINTTFDLPMSEAELQRHVEQQYDNPYYDIHHYEIRSEEEQVAEFGKVLVPPKTWVDESYYNGTTQLILDSFPDLSSTQKTITYNNRYIFSSDGFDNSFVVNTQNANFETYGTGLGSDGGFVLYSPKRGGSISDGYLRFRGSGERFSEFFQLDATYLTQFTFKGKFGTNLNGGEIPDLAQEILKLQYRTSPSSSWVDIDIIAPLGMVQYFEFDGTPQGSLGNGGPGRVQGVYENVDLYYSVSSAPGTPMGAKVTVTVEANGIISDISITDRGVDIPSTTVEGWIRNEDIGNGFYYGAPEQLESDKVYQPDVYISTLSTKQTPSGVQFGRYSTEPYAFVIQVPPGAKTPSTEFRLFQPSNTGEAMDQYAIQEIKYDFEQTYTVETDINYTEIDADNFVIEGQRWTRVSGAWYRVVQNGIRYHDSGVTKVTSGDKLSRPVTESEYESYENEKKREIYILKPIYVDILVEDFRKAALYKKSSDYVSNKLKQTGV
tara:strand:- start:128 stop:1846 length:1719 start_codon:yes stop_codon:yes gene_type:complete